MEYWTAGLTEIRELTPLSLVIRGFLAFILGGMLGLERGMKNRPAGLRTYMLVCLGSCIVTMTNQYVYQAYRTGDPVRMGAQVISGIGFLGAGTIVVTSRNQIKGLTTAAGLWASACMGLAVGLGLYEVAIASTLMIFLILNSLHTLDNRMHSRTRVVELYVELNKKTPLGDFLRYIRGQDMEPSNIQMEHDEIIASHTVSFIVTLKGQKSHTHREILGIVKAMKGVVYVEEL